MFLQLLGVLTKLIEVHPIIERLQTEFKYEFDPLSINLATQNWSNHWIRTYHGHLTSGDSG